MSNSNNLFKITAEKNLDKLLINNPEHLICVLFSTGHKDYDPEHKNKFIKTANLNPNVMFLYVHLQNFHQYSKKYIQHITSPIKYSFFFNKEEIAIVQDMNYDDFLYTLESITTQLDKKQQEYEDDLHKNTIQSVNNINNNFDKNQNINNISNTSNNVLDNDNDNSNNNVNDDVDNNSDGSVVSSKSNVSNSVKHLQDDFNDKFNSMNKMLQMIIRSQQNNSNTDETPKSNNINKQENLNKQENTNEQLQKMKHLSNLQIAYNTIMQEQMNRLYQLQQIKTQKESSENT